MAHDNAWEPMVMGEEVHNAWDKACATRAHSTGTDGGPVAVVAGARCWVCRPSRPNMDDPFIKSAIADGQLAACGRTSCRMVGPHSHADTSEPFHETDLRPYLDAAHTAAVELAAFDPDLLVDPVDTTALERIGRDLLTALRIDPDAAAVKETPARWARWWKEFLDYDPGNLGTHFEEVSSEQLVVVRDVEVWSLCEHHLLPFKTVLTMGYLTDAHVIGLSKFARVAHQHAHGLQMQERLVKEIADGISELAGTKNVAVIGTGEHLCMAMRGIKSAGEMITSHLGGRFMESELRAEFLSFHKGR